ncbi:hypothetical protein [Rhizobium leguminosarum]|uniref:hypothetical protein n=1 Tax=Rhizobium leguminosarum TaxID=384 RepID=UPI001037CADF|nr:hypothetical protein [Rhizobium leguminosarum]TBF85710.1 hypothetical protein ELG85_37255 [Rhizobium leguminosarum]
MRTEDEKQELAGLIDIFKRANYREVTDILIGTGIATYTWYKAAAGTAISDANFDKILEIIYSSKVDGITSRNEFGSYTVASMREYEGYFKLYRPNSEDKTKIEVFSAMFKWSPKDRCLMFYVRNLDSQSEFFVHRPKTHSNISLRGVSTGWSSLYILGNRIHGTTCISGVSVAMDTIVPGEALFHPILFPIVLEKVSTEALDPYHQLDNGSHEYERVEALLKASVNANVGVVETVWSRFKMPGNSNGGPNTVRKPARD